MGLDVLRTSFTGCIRGEIEHAANRYADLHEAFRRIPDRTERLDDENAMLAMFRQGYGDLFLALDRRFPDAKVSWLLELKHLKAGASEAEVAKVREEARAQIDRYLADETALPALMGHRTIRAATVLLVGSSDLRWWVEREV